MNALRKLGGSGLTQDDIRAIMEYRKKTNWVKGDKGRFAGSVPMGGGGAAPSKNAKLDLDGKPFKYPPVRLPKKEYARVMSEIAKDWHTKYEGRELCRIVFVNKTYYFENHSFGDYNIYRVTKEK